MLHRGDAGESTYVLSNELSRDAKKEMKFLSLKDKSKCMLVQGMD